MNLRKVLHKDETLTFVRTHCRIQVIPGVVVSWSHCSIRAQHIRPGYLQKPHIKETKKKQFSFQYLPCHLNTDVPSWRGHLSDIESYQ